MFQIAFDKQVGLIKKWLILKKLIQKLHQFQTDWLGQHLTANFNIYIFQEIAGRLPEKLKFGYNTFEEAIMDLKTKILKAQQDIQQHGTEGLTNARIYKEMCTIIKLIIILLDC